MHRIKKGFYKKYLSAFLLIFCCIALTASLDHYFFKLNHHFLSRIILPPLSSSNSQWDLPSISPEEIDELAPILSQRFSYLGKGNQCIAFVSEDNRYVIKFHKYPTLIKGFRKKKKNKPNPLKTLHYNLSNYKNSFKDLREENGLILMHINKTDLIKKNVTVIDSKQKAHKIPLDQVTFILQYKADLIYPKLQQLYKQGEIESAKQKISQIIELIATTSAKGYINCDPVLYRNYGLLADRAIHIDIGDLVKEESLKDKQTQLDYIKRVTDPLRLQIETHYPQLLAHFHTEIEKLQ